MNRRRAGPTEPARRRKGASIGGDDKECGRGADKEPHGAHPQSGPDPTPPSRRGACDMWGRPVAADETPDEEAARLLMSLNWVCDLLEHMARNPVDADRRQADCAEFVSRIAADCHSQELRKGLADAAVCIAEHRYRDASAILRSLAV